ncbi:MAG: Holliday junction branch migration protein RuvA [Chlamydiales bacterium]|nr:Holliday junction branch migration protein RuvA [Chlamydiia bacterium]MCP5508013.1 Holliday junction branch migration protein RuvA [Chlamydiales bacterium]
MINYIRGTLTESTPTVATIEAHGLGYQVLIPASLFGELPATGNELLLYTSFVVREDSQKLFGFISKDERDLFEVLIGVSGIGPKTALSLIGHLPARQLCQAIQNNDIPAICKVPGIGKKSAERLIIEIRDRLPALCASDPSGFFVQTKNDPRAQQIQDAMSALVNLGYTQNTAQKAIKKTLETIPDAIDLAELITLSLKNV